ncbi:TetR family transcriptional regulator [Tumebacillus sp. BK434]|uniref:TetR/AcrR family transcriptional regulator n=1 Tax=Tumebacillus sp. BK434 TaxID=2512169 RepID=UPI0010DA9A95|nr:TetR/AcrR family transcriptional regulator [Tumebacillus sp. BK434]TCP58305.1 TetR family transcriptional regulator [Tumebacillus sp. BK434]
MSEEKLNFDKIEEELTEKHWQILEAAMKVFSEKGFSAARTSEVAKEAGVSEGTIFNYFKTKKDLLTSMVIPLVVRFFRPLILLSVEKIFKTRKERPVEDVLLDVMRDRVQLVEKNLPLIKTVAAEAAFHPELLRPVREELAPKLVEVASKFFQEEVEKGTFRDIDPVLALRGLMSLLGGYVLMKNIAPEALQIEDEETELRKLLDLYLHGVLNKRE